ncbi:MAG: aminotransferase class V-fold PLP-dependent enzyme [Phycisphaerales bacterium]|nr:aminotransferase class V-fold PLP-dependent enzyme [Phycisphaerales bacterium]
MTHQDQSWPGPHALRERWLLDPSCTFLNHGSFGACLKAVLDVQQSWQQRLERQPVRFFVHELDDLLANVRHRLGEFIGADPENLALVTNTTQGVSTVLRSLAFSPSDELVMTDHTYPAVHNAVHFIAQHTGATVRIAHVPFPIRDSQQATDAITAALTDRTRLLVIDHITSPTGLILPIERIISEANDRGIPILVDGAHGPGMLPLDLESLGAAFYTGNCHKWVCAPKGAAFLWVDPSRQDELQPLSISLGLFIQRPGESRFRAEFKYTGTWDPSALLSIPAAIDFFAQLPGGWDAVQRHNRELALQARTLLCEALDTEPPTPDAMVGSLATVTLPPGPSEPLETRLAEEFNIETPIIAWPWRSRTEPGPRWIRISAQVYNDLTQYEYLARCLQQCLSDE